MGSSSVAPAAWSVSASNDVATTKLQKELGIGSLLARVLASRGLTDIGAAARYLNPALENLHPPEKLPDYALARSVLLDARDRKQTIFVHGDYDVDGVTSAALLTRFLQNVGCAVTTHVPHRQREGYGIHSMAVDFAKEAGAEVFLTCDCGTAAIAQVELAKEYGMRVVVTDHHEVGTMLPNAEAVINPHRPDSKYPFTELSGVGVAFKLCMGLTSELGYSNEKYIRAFSDLAALGTIADVMPLIDENRIIARHGLGYLPQTKKLGLQALMRTIGIEPGAPVRSWDVGFRIGPRLNAAGRVDDARTSLDLLLTSDPLEAQRLAESVEANNKARREAQVKMIEEAQEMIESDPGGLRRFVVVGSSNWHPGVVGIVAGRLVERYNRPALVVGIDQASGFCKGSARSVPGFNLASAIHAFPELMQGGGHAAAAGCSFAFENFEAVKEALHGYAMSHISDEDLVPRLYADVEGDLDDFTLEAVSELSALEPFGRENCEPVFSVPNAILQSARLTKDGKHVQMTLRTPSGRSVDGIAFGKGEAFEELTSDASYDLYFEAKVDEWNGRQKVKLMILDYRRI